MNYIQSSKSKQQARPLQQPATRKHERRPRELSTGDPMSDKRRPSEQSAGDGAREENLNWLPNLSLVPKIINTLLQLFSPR
ncbi:hypothetical protein TIFTF001_034295 [Ficus carica]|uniref:Uncharacterized protein n=1 Tax=Ficus carica TaxID=3494 RepID=A0AA88E7K9_FICCA|nr:hypothetical protein TIFTF001_034295 [Ficus carica]